MEGTPILKLPSVGQKICQTEKFIGQNIGWFENLLVKKFVGPKICWSKNLWVREFFGLTFR